MNTPDPYATPSADLDTTAGNGYHAVGALKLTLMYLCTFGLYAIYWFYKNFAYIKRRLDLDIWPFWRAMFGPFWATSLAAYVSAHREEFDLPRVPTPAAVGAAYLILTLAGLLPDPLWLIAFFAFLPLLLIDKAADQANMAMNIDTTGRKKLNALNWVGIILGGLMFALILVGLFLPEIE